MMESRATELVDKILAEIAAQAPPMVLRTHPQMKEWTGVGARRLANLDSEGKGPREKVLLGRQVAYPRESLLAWVAGRLKAA